MSINVLKIVSKPGVQKGSKMVTNGQKWPAKMWNQHLSVLHHRIITTLTFSKWFAAIEPKLKNILAGQEIFSPP